MRTRLLASAGAAALLVAAPAASRAEPTSKPKPRLVLIDRTPLTLRGTSFARTERVRVVVETEGRTWERRTRATGRGAFTVVFQDIAQHPCSGVLTARAIGTNGSRAVLKLGPQPLCPPPLRP
jgi:hypothetical protein